jgi:hypothetical protein
MKWLLLALLIVGKRTVVENDFRYIFFTPERGCGSLAIIL